MFLKHRQNECMVTVRTATNSNKQAVCVLSQDVSKWDFLQPNGFYPRKQNVAFNLF